jgi:hypothetical protein
VLVFAFIGFLNSCTGLCIASLIFSLIGSISNPGGNGRVALLQFHIITPNSEGKAIWNCELSGGGFKKAVNLTITQKTRKVDLLNMNLFCKR